MSTAKLGTLELTVLLAVHRLDENAYGLALRRDLEARTGRDHSVGAIYTTLDRLQQKGLVSSRASNPTPERGGRSRRVFKVTADGLRSIRAAEAMTRSVWSGVAANLHPRRA
jgi:PadR family transcriptional regulator, regulatory protein PadR